MGSTRTKSSTLSIRKYNLRFLENDISFLIETSYEVCLNQNKVLVHYSNILIKIFIDFLILSFIKPQLLGGGGGG